jgi:23S rRNA (cytosine1962-C5)-methyltransferase
VFSQAVATDTQTENGALVEVRSSRGEPLGIGTRNGQTSIRIRMITRDVTEPIDVAFFATRFRALRAWKEKHLPPKTTGYRLVHAESDGIPGLIIDRYAEVFVMQLHTAGMELLRQTIVDALMEVFAPQAIVERSDVNVRRTEGLHDEPVGVLYGKVDDAVPFLETGLTFLADVLEGQKNRLLFGSTRSSHTRGIACDRPTRSKPLWIQRRVQRPRGIRRSAPGRHRRCFTQSVGFSQT